MPTHSVTSISIIIPVWNGHKYLPACLDSIFAQLDAQCQLKNDPTLSVEVIAVDNASDDDSSEFIRKHYPAVRLLQQEKNWGFAGGCNRGAQIAQSDLLIFLNQDTKVAADWLQKLSSAFAKPEIGVAGCKIYYFDGKKIQHAGMRIELPRFATPHIGYHEMDVGQFSHSHAVDCVTGAALAIRRKLFNQLEGFDEEFWPGYFEDTDLCMRAKELGNQIWFVADATLSHQESTSIADRIVRDTFHHLGRLRLSLKHLPPEKWIEEFFLAERNVLTTADLGTEVFSLQFAFRQFKTEVYPIVKTVWNADFEVAQQILECLTLLESVLSLRGGPQELIPENSVSGETLSQIAPTLTEIEFHSAVPILGPWIRSVRLLWYNIAARWGDSHLRNQQEIINRQQETINRQQATQIYFLKQQLSFHQQLLQSYSTLMYFERERENRKKHA